MSIPKFETFTSGAVPVEVENIDTDQIIVGCIIWVHRSRNKDLQEK